MARLRKKEQCVRTTFEIEGCALDIEVMYRDLEMREFCIHSNTASIEIDGPSSEKQLRALHEALGELLGGTL